MRTTKVCLVYETATHLLLLSRALGLHTLGIVQNLCLELPGRQGCHDLLPAAPPLSTLPSPVPNVTTPARAVQRVCAS